jgi:hypothetical protein
MELVDKILQILTTQDGCSYRWDRPLKKLDNSENSRKHTLLLHRKSFADWILSLSPLKIITEGRYDSRHCPRTAKPALLWPRAGNRHHKPPPPPIMFQTKLRRFCGAPPPPPPFCVKRNAADFLRREKVFCSVHVAFTPLMTLQTCVAHQSIVSIAE